MSNTSTDDQFRAAMRRFASTVSVITCATPDGWFGITATAVTSVCMSPPTLLICVNQSTSLHPKLHQVRHFCVNMLQTDQVEIAHAFSGKRQGQDRFNVGTWALSDTGVVLLDAQASIQCTLVNSIEHGTHSVFLGQVKSVRVTNKVSPLVYQDGLYTHAQPLVEAEMG